MWNINKFTRPVENKKCWEKCRIVSLLLAEVGNWCPEYAYLSLIRIIPRCAICWQVLTQVVSIENVLSKAGVSCFCIPVSQKFAGGGTVGVHGVGRERAEAGKSALPGTLAARPAHGHSRQGHVGATAERPAQRTETQIKHQERVRGPERLLRTQNGQDRHH